MTVYTGIVYWSFCYTAINRYSCHPEASWVNFHRLEAGTLPWVCCFWVWHWHHHAFSTGNKSSARQCSQDQKANQKACRQSHWSAQIFLHGHIAVNDLTPHCLEDIRYAVDCTTLTYITLPYISTSHGITLLYFTHMHCSYMHIRIHSSHTPMITYIHIYIYISYLYKYHLHTITQTYIHDITGCYIALYCVKINHDLFRHMQTYAVSHWVELHSLRFIAWNCSPDIILHCMHYMALQYIIVVTSYIQPYFTNTSPLIKHKLSMHQPLINHWATIIEPLMNY